MSLRIASYNIRKCIGLDRRRDPHRTADVIQALQADIILLQEADKRLGARPAALPRDVIAQFTHMHPQPEREGSHSLGAHGNAILINPNVSVEGVDFKNLPGTEPRGCVIADLHTQQGPMRVVGVHLGLRRKDRLKQLLHLRSHLDALPARPTIIAGDFNEWSGKKGLEPLKDMQVLSPGRSFHAARPIAHLDRIAHCTALTLHAAGVDKSPLARHASDHLPVWAEFTVDDPV